MNYRHIFHAGNVCDVVKHAVLTMLVARLSEKEKPFCLLDTHAGGGLYDIREPRALKTGEAQDGILRFLAAPRLPKLGRYYGALQTFNPEWDPENQATLSEFRVYPGSPLLGARLARPKDRIIACELHPEEAAALRRNIHAYRNIQIHNRDGFEALQALLPPPEKRGMVLIDPPYEVPHEFERLVPALGDLHRVWPQGVAAVWYPVKERPALWRFHEKLAASGIPRLFCAEFIYEEEARHDRLNGCGFIFLNPPWRFEEELHELFSALHAALGSAHRGVKLEWLAEEGDAVGKT